MTLLEPTFLCENDIEEKWWKAVEDGALSLPNKLGH
jgi:hypothetical protein